MTMTTGSSTPVGSSPGEFAGDDHGDKREFESSDGRDAHGVTASPDPAPTVSITAPATAPRLGYSGHGLGQRLR